MAEGIQGLRDQFAVAAMNGFVASEDYSGNFEEIAKASYTLADAMLRARGPVTTEKPVVLIDLGLPARAYNCLHAHAQISNSDPIEKILAINPMRLRNLGRVSFIHICQALSERRLKISDSKWFKSAPPAWKKCREIERIFELEVAR